jgi:hypothetical protein
MCRYMWALEFRIELVATLRAGREPARVFRCLLPTLRESSTNEAGLSSKFLIIGIFYFLQQEGKTVGRVERQRNPPICGTGKRSEGFA